MLLKLVILFFLLSGGAYAQEPAAKAVDPNTPAPSSGISFRLPHSERTKGNLLDTALDFLLMRLFRQFKDMNITYDFFEIDSEHKLHFTNFKVDVKRSDAQGVLSVQKIVIDSSEFIAFLQSREPLTSKIKLEKILVDLKLIRKRNTDGVDQIKTRQLNVSANGVFITDMFLYAADTKAPLKEELKIKEATGTDVKVSLSDPKEKYAASSFELKDVIVYHHSGPSGEQVSVSSAKADGKTYGDFSAFLQAIRQ